MKLKKLLSQAAAIVLCLALLVCFLPVTAKAAEAKPLSEHKLGTVFKLSEDGTLYDWILISHNYEGAENQLLMRKDCIYYATGIVYGYYYDDGESSTTTCTPKFSSSSFRTYLNSDYFTKFDSLISERFQEINIETYETGSSNIIEDTIRIFILSENEVFGSVSIYSDYNYCTNTATGTYIDYFSSDEMRAADQRYMLRDGECSGTYRHSSHPQYGGSSVNTAGKRDYGYNNYSLISTKRSGWYSPTNYYRPCLVLPANTIAVEGEEINGEIIPSIDSIDVPDKWAQQVEITVNADNAEIYAITSENSIPDSGWQRSNKFKISANGKYYAWVKSATENAVSAEFNVDHVDKTPPVISAINIPDEWATSISVSISAADSQSGVAAYTVTNSNIEPDEASVWQKSQQFSFSQNGTYYAWAKDTAGNISVGFAFKIDRIDKDKPVISHLTYPTEWTNDAVLTITATDETSSLLYALSSSSTLPTDGWQSEPTFKLTANGNFYAWVKDEAGNYAKQIFYFSKFDGEAPIISNVSFSDSWAASSNVKITATDNGSGISGYAITDTNAIPTDSSAWQTSQQFSLTANGKYYAWVRDNAGNISSGYEFDLNKIDDSAPIITDVSVPTGWAASKTVVVSAKDNESGISGYITTNSNSIPAAGAAWQTSPSFTFKSNGKFFAWVKDNAGNISNSFAFEVENIDSDKPVISNLTYPTEWTNDAVLTITAADETSSLLYSLSSSSTLPTDGWQSEPTFKLTANGSFYAWVKDEAGNYAKQIFYFQKFDGEAPVISNVSFSDSWAASSNVKITAADNGSGIFGYAVTDTNAIPTDSSAWQTSQQFSLDSNGKYFAWVKDNAGNISSGYEFDLNKIDDSAPVIIDVSVPTGWSASKTVVISAKDNESGISGYLTTTSDSIPAAGAAWQTSPSFTFKSNGKFFAWVKDAAGNISNSFAFEVENIDSDKPVISNLTYPTDWTNDAVLTITATDETSSLLYALSNSSTLPTDGWQSEPTFKLTANGSFYAWVKDEAGNYAKHIFYFSKFDGEAPVISSVTFADSWAASSTVKITATDNGSGISGYAISDTNSAPTDSSAWQASQQFSLTANGKYFAWVKDNAGNISSGYEFDLNKIDDSAPVIIDVSVPTGWSASKTVIVSAKDNESGISGYLTTNSDSIPAAGTAWQTSPSFTFKSNGKFFAWAKDTAGNISNSFAFEIENIDSDKPVISNLTYPTEWTNDAVLTITAADETSSLLYSLSNSSTLPTDGWQSEPTFKLNSNGSFYAWVKDTAGNSASKFFHFSKLDGDVPEITSIQFNTANTVMTVSASDSASGIACIIIDSVEYENSYIQYKIPTNTRYLTVQAKDNAGNLSAEQRVRVPGWYDTLSTLTITSVEFNADVAYATITAESTATQIQGIYVNDVLYEANPVIYQIADGTKYLVMQAVDVNGDRSSLYKVRVPNWTEEISSLEIVGCVFSEDNSYATVTAAENVENEADRRGIAGIFVNGEFLEGNPVIYPIPEGTRHLEMKARNTDGDYSPTLIRRVPGWSEVVSTLSIVNCEFSNYNKRATVTALATGGDSVAGIFVNGEFFEGNPVVYDIDKNTDILHLQAANFNGDLSAMVNRDVPRDSSKSTLKLTITAPDWTNAARAKVKITATDKASIHEILAKTGDEEDWEDITDKLYIYITEDTTVWASVENDEGTVKETHLDITCFDRKAPTVSAAQQDNVVNIRAEDDKSGVKAIYVNNVEYSGSKIYGGNLRYTIPDGVTTVKIKAADEAGNESEMVELAVKATVTAIPMIVSPSEPSAVSPEPEPPAAVIPEPEQESQPEEEPPVIEPEPEPEIEEDPEAAGLTTEQLISLALGAFAMSCAGTGSFIWWLIRKRRQNSVVPELDFDGCKLEYDESEYHGSIDPLDENVTEVDFNKKVS